MFAFLKKLGKNDRHTLYICYWAFICNGLLSLMIGSSVPDLKQSYGMNDSLIGVFLAAHSAGNLAAGLLSGWIPLYLGRKHTLVVLGSLAFIGFLMIVLWGDPIWLFVAFLFTGIGRGIVTNFNNHRSNLLSGGSSASLNLMHAAFAVGAILAPMLFLLGQSTLGWRSGLILVAVLGFCSLWAMNRMTIADDHPDRKDRSQSSLEFLKNPSYLVLALMLFCYLCSEYSINGWLVSYLQNKESLVASFGVTGEALTKALSNYSQFMATLFWAVILVGRLTCAFLSTRLPPKRMMMANCFGIVAFFALMLMSNTITMVTLSVAGLGFCMSGISPMIFADASYFTNHYSMATGTLSAIASFGGIFMPAAVGFAAERFGFGGGMSLIYVTIILLLVGSVINVRMKPRVPLEGVEGEKNAANT